MLNYSLSADSWDDREVAALNRVISSGRYTMGEEVRAFEDRVAQMHGVKNAVMTNSGSSANLISIAALALHPKFEAGRPSGVPNIIVPSVSWSTTYYPISQWGFEIKFADVNLETFNLCVDDVERKLDQNTVAIFTVNLLGNSSNLKRLQQLCEANQLTLIEDNCESFGAVTPCDRYCGSVGEMGTLSFFFSHHLQTMEGGMVLCKDDDVADYLRSLRAHGWVRDFRGDGLYQPTGDPFEDSYRFVLPGYCVRPLEMSGAVGRVQLEKWPEMLEVRRANAEVAVSELALPDVALQREFGKSSWFGFGMVLRGGLEGKRKKVVSLLKQHGVEVRPIVAGNFQKNPVIRHLRCIQCEAPNADRIHEDGFFIGNDSIDLREKIEGVANLLRSGV